MVRRHIHIRWKLALRRTRQFVMERLIHADDTPHRLALGVALGVFVTFTPTIGAQMALVAAGAWLLGANRVVGLPVVWLSNPLTIVPIYYPSYVIGCLILRNSPSMADWSMLRMDHGGWWPNVVHFWKFAMNIAMPLWLGSLMVGLIMGIVTYATARYAINYYRQKQPFSRWKRKLTANTTSRLTAPHLARTTDTIKP